ncbi:MAG: hypothetical protein Q4C01_01820 [Clostridia bacterium]|nr:hypothetical protein [Clostridia bacterium]
MEKRREVGFDIMMPIAIFGYFLSAIAWRTTTSGGVIDGAATVYMAIGSFCLPLVLFLLGAKFLDPEREFTFKKHWLGLIKIVVSGLLWTVAYTSALYIINKAQFHPLQFLKTAYTVLPHMRYVLQLACLYVFIPVLRMIAANKKISLYFMAVSFVTASLIPMLAELPVIYRAKYLLSFTDFSLFMGYSGMLVAGYYFKANPIKRLYRSIIYALAALALAFSLAGTVGGLFDGYGLFKIAFDQCPANFVLYGLGVYVLLCTVLDKLKVSDRGEEVAKKISQCSYGSYVSSLFFIKAAAMIGISGTMFAPIAAIPLVAILCFALTYGFTYILKGVPIVRDWLV